MNDNVFFQHGFPQQQSFVSNRDYLKSSGTEFTEVDDVFDHGSERDNLLSNVNHVSYLILIIIYTLYNIELLRIIHVFEYELLTLSNNRSDAKNA